MAHALNPSTQELEAGRSLCLRSTAFQDSQRPIRTNRTNKQPPKLKNTQSEKEVKSGGRRLHWCLQKSSRLQAGGSMLMEKSLIQACMCTHLHVHAYGIGEGAVSRRSSVNVKDSHSHTIGWAFT